MIYDPQLALFGDLRHNVGPRPKRKYKAKDARTFQPKLTNAQIEAANKLATYFEPEAEPQPKLSREERAAADPRIATFHDELAAYRQRHPTAHDTRTPLRMGSMKR